MRKYRIKKADLEMNLAPLIDIVFLLLIFFMVASTLNMNEVQATIQLPGTNTVEGKSIKEIALYITKEGQVFLEKEKIGWEQLSDILDEFMIKNKTKEVTVYADKEADFQYIVNMLDLANKLKINQIQFSLHHQ
ncbi:MAG: biopolymer transporter ExbD [Candidatus Caldatribacteriota bacterium]|nr:biopolymer transporter ExbD [Candidatus Caldatribacteriota bacterium]